MRHIVVFVLALTIPGCAFFDKKPLADKPLVSCVKAPAALVDTCKGAVDVLNKTNLLVASINDGIGRSFDAGTLTKDQAKKYRARTKTADDQLDHVYALVTDADFANASIQAALVKALVDALNREVAAQIAKGVK